MFKPLKSVSVVLLLFAMPAAISYAASENGATSVSVTQQNGTCKGVVKDKAGEAVIGASVVGLVSATLVVELVLSWVGLQPPKICLHIYAADVCSGNWQFCWCPA